MWEKQCQTGNGLYHLFIVKHIYPYGSKYLLRRNLTPQIMPQILPQKLLGSIGYGVLWWFTVVYWGYNGWEHHNISQNWLNWSLISKYRNLTNKHGDVSGFHWIKNNYVWWLWGYSEIYGDFMGFNGDFWLITDVWSFERAQWWYFDGAEWWCVIIYNDGIMGICTG